MIMTEINTSVHGIEDQQLARRLQHELLLSQPEATDFEEIWRRAEGQLQNQAEKQPLWRRFNLGKPWVSASYATALLLMCTLVLVQFKPSTGPVEYQQPLLSAIAMPDDELFKALIQSTQWVAPSDQFLQQQPQLKVWGLPALNVQSPGSS
jgi:hypothetical protein